MSYRTFKHLLGETSLERKCRFIFGAGILILVTLSFYIYGQKTEALVVAQNPLSARRLIKPTLMDLHYKEHVDPDFGHVIDGLSADLDRQGDIPRYGAHIINPNSSHNAELKQPRDSYEAAALKKFEDAAKSEEAMRETGVPLKPLTFANGVSREEMRNVPGKTEYQYIQAILLKPSCLGCHSMRNQSNGLAVFTKAGDFAGAVAINLPMEQINKDIATNRAMLISAALLTAIIAMVSSYVIVRYVIVKPVKHLRDVTDLIAAGKLNVRAQIQTGDEFEDLSHAFNRMLHNLVAMQQALREVNHDLDKKVDELAQANMALFEMNRLKSDFLATMSHELRTPLNSIIGFSEVLSSSEGLNDRQRRYAANIQTSGKMLLGMINDILDLAKIESGKMEVRPDDFSIRDVLEALSNLMRPMADRKEIAIECRLDDAIPLLRQDPGKLRQIVYNLLSNAIKFTPEGGRVWIRAQPDGRFVVIEVEDTGIGIAEEDRDKIFEKFRQANSNGGESNVLTREHQGTGLGLSIVRELAKLLGGDVQLQSEPGQGSTFTVRLPMQLPGNRRFEITLADERIDLSKARRIEPRIGLGPTSSPLSGSLPIPEPLGLRRNRPDLPDRGR